MIQPLAVQAKYVEVPVMVRNVYQAVVKAVVQALVQAVVQAMVQTGLIANATTEHLQQVPTAQIKGTTSANRATLGITYLENPANHASRATTRGIRRLQAAPA
jgi:hypothetical protein